MLPGDRGEIQLDIVLEDPQHLVAQGVLFLNVVVNDRERGWPQAAHLVFSSASEQPSVFRRVVSAEDLRNGLRTTVAFSIRDRAPLDDYSLVVQFFSGKRTNPHRVRLDDKVGQVGFPFRIAAAPTTRTER